MGGCCCCFSKGTEVNSAQTYYYHPRASEERVPLSSHHGSVAVLSTGLLVDTNLDTSIPDTYRSPPAPMPFDVALGRPQTPQGTLETGCGKNDKAAQTTNSDPIEETAGINTQEISAKSEGVKELDCKAQTNLEPDSAKELELEISKPVESLVPAAEEEDVCPTCLEEYDTENPKITTKCEHHFHLACILEWMERSDTCPVCDKEMIIDLPID